MQHVPCNRRTGLRLLAWLLLSSVASSAAPALGEGGSAGIRVPDGFNATLYADDDLASDIFSMAVDSQGRIVVSGPDYVRILIDRDGDGKADSYQQFADGPKTGAQGLCFDGRDLICSGDAGLIRYRDRDGDDRADGPPELLMKINAGGEHHVHAIRQGPDGSWYVIAGNHSGIDEGYASLPTSPIRKPEGGALLRLTPDLRRCEIVADGFRNAYDFAFGPLGDVFVYDSDGERDVSLPWYRPTRVFHALPGSHAGFVSRSWKRADDFADMPPVVGAFGRGSPTGVVCYRHTQFPEPYRDAVFILDWTFGRVIALPLKADGSTWQAKPVTFMTGVGQFGFAPTDAAVGPDGSLYVSVGGRGTRGGVFRVTYGDAKKRFHSREHGKGSGRSNFNFADGRSRTLEHRQAKLKFERPDPPPHAVAAGSETASKEANSRPAALSACLRAPQPLSTWSRAVWLPPAKELGREPFLESSLDEKRPHEERVRAVEIVTELFGGLDADAAARLADSPSAEVRARAAWSIGRTEPAVPDSRPLLPYLKDESPLVRRFALEALVGAGDATDFAPILPALVERLGDQDRFVRQAVARVVPRLKPDACKELAALAVKAGDRATLSFALGRLLRSSAVDEPALRVGMGILEARCHAGNRDSWSESSTLIMLDAVRLMQLALGDVGPRPDSKLAPVFDGYSSRIDLSGHKRALDAYQTKLAKIYPTGDRTVDLELARLLAMLSPRDPALLEKVLARISGNSHPVDDVHHLIVAARIPAGRTEDQSRRITTALVALDTKIAARKLNQDSNWDDRVGEIYAELVRFDPELPVRIAGHADFGRPGHVIFLTEVPGVHAQEAIAAFAQKIESDGDYRWTPETVFALGKSNDQAHLDLVRRQFETFAVRSAVLMTLARTPAEQDREKFVEGLDSSQIEVLTACVEALSKLPPSHDGREQFALLRTLRRLGREPREFPLGEDVVKLLRRNTGQEFGFVFGAKGRIPQAEVIARWTEWLSQEYPDEARRGADSGADAAHLKSLIARVDWTRGDAERGGKLFLARACAQCHGERRALGPDLTGVARRFSREDLFTAIAVPNRDVSPRYQTTLVQTGQGKVYSGLVVYESVDGVTLRDANGQTFRIEAAEIEERRTLTTSLMPAGLLKDLEPRDLADLDAYLRSLD